MANGILQKKSSSEGCTYTIEDCGNDNIFPQGRLSRTVTPEYINRRGKCVVPSVI